MSSGTTDGDVMNRTETDVDLCAIDEQILTLFKEGRCPRRYLSNELDVTGEYAYQRVDLLENPGFVRIIHDRCNELSEDDP